MGLVRMTLVGLLLLGAAPAASAADRCLTGNEQRAKTAAHAVIPLSRAMRAVRAHGEIIRARLCEHGGRLVYVLTVLSGDGKVAEAGVDAGNGAVVALREQEKSEKQDKTDKPEKAEKTDRAEKPEKSQKAEKSDKPDKSDKPEKPDKKDK
jgi:outer membrane biosynthesis protein TonB